MDYYIQILCRFRKCKRKVPPSSPFNDGKNLHGIIGKLRAYETAHAVAQHKKNELHK